MKIIGDTDCPHCKKSHEAEIDIDNLDIKQLEKPQVKVREIQGSVQAQVLEQPEPKEPEIITKVKIPGHIPKYKCKNCDKAHDNPDYKLRPRFKCSNCGQLNPTAQCQFCDKAEDFEELSDDDLDEMGIKAPEHKHEHEE